MNGTIIEYDVEVEEVDQVAISPDGQYIVSVVEKRSVYALTSSGNFLWSKSFTSWVDAVSISGGDHVILVASGGALFLLGSDGSQIWKKSFNDVSDAAISGNGAYIVVGAKDSSFNNVVQVLDRDGNTLYQSTVASGEVLLSVSSDASYIAVGSIRDVTLLNRQCQQLWSKKVDFSIGSIAVSSSGNVAVDASSVSLFDSSGVLLWGGESWTRPSHGVSISGDGKCVAASIGDDVSLLDSLGGIIWSQKVGENLMLEDIAISSDGMVVVAAARSFVVPGQGMIYILDNPPGTDVIKKPSILRSRLDCYSDSSFSQIGKTVKVSGSITPPTTSAAINLEYTRPSGESMTRTVSTNTYGSYSDSLTTDQIGTWRVNATFTGSDSLKPSNASTLFYVEVVGERENAPPYQPDGTVAMELGEKRFFKTPKSGMPFYKYNVLEVPPSVEYSGSYTQVFGGTDPDYIGSTIKVMPWATPGTYKIRTEWGWGGSPIVTGAFTYTYHLDFNIEVKPPHTKYATDIIISAVGKGDTFNATGATYIKINGQDAPLPGQTITLTYTRPNGQETKKTITTNKDGTFNDRLRTDAGGDWKVKATFEGTTVLESSSSVDVAFKAEATSPLSQIPVPWESVLIGLALCFIILARARSSHIHQGTDESRRWS
ncbi:TPA: PQQ-binding-like beta-propeller repeat protein [Candidatus Bathyarchaeota archaeon]|nr:PQQ-binding-like beta-propeller repeat protein [Candidatus Bathyarchaeota archaeon]